MIPIRAADGQREMWHEHYFWRSDTELCLFRPILREGQLPYFELAGVSRSGHSSGDFARFNTIAAPAIHAREVHVRCEGIPGEEVYFTLPPFAAAGNGNWVA